jgi:hypothetical protein
MRGLVLAGVVVSALVLAGGARAYGGDYVFEGGSDAAREQVRQALEASRFDWSLVPGEITIRITDCGCSGASPGEILLDEHVLTGEEFGPDYAWGLVQHEYAHQVAYLLLDAQARRRVRAWLGGSDWCYEQAGVAHDDQACERFASSLAWAYWPRRKNIMAAENVVSAREFRTTFTAILQALQDRFVQRGLPSAASSATLRQAT